MTNKRILTVSEISSYHYQPVPFIRIQGQWLRNLGFETGDKILVEEGRKNLHISVITPEKEGKGR